MFQVFPSINQAKCFIRFLEIKIKKREGSEKDNSQLDKLSDLPPRIHGGVLRMQTAFYLL